MSTLTHEQLSGTRQIGVHSWLRRGWSDYSPTGFVGIFRKQALTTIGHVVRDLILTPGHRSFTINAERLALNKPGYSVNNMTMGKRYYVLNGKFGKPPGDHLPRFPRRKVMAS
jgi:hypothetical protein